MSLRLTRVITFLWTACIVGVTLARGSELGQHMRTVGALHLAVHVCVFFVLGVLLTASLSTQGIDIRILTLLLGVALGVSTEVYEHLAFRNEMEYVDVVANALGVVLGFTAGETLKPRARV